MDPFFQRFQLLQTSRNVDARSTEMTNAIFVDRDSNLWLGTETGYIENYSSDGKLINSFKSENHRYPGQGVFIKTIIQDPEGNILVGSYMGGLMSFKDVSDTKGKWVRSEGKVIEGRDVVCSYMDDDGVIWLGTNGGFARYQDGMLQEEYIDTSLGGGTSQLVNVITKIGDRLYLGGSTLGIRVYNTATGEYEAPINTENSELADNTIYDFHVDEKERLWVGTNQGLQLINLETMEFTSWTVFDGLSNNVVYSIVGSNQYIWMSTSFGVTRYDRVNDQMQAFHKTDGLAGDRFRKRAGFKAADGTMYMASNSGISYFKDGDVSRDMHIGRLVFTKFKMNDQEVSPSPDGVLTDIIDRTEEIVLPYDHPMLSFEFTLLNFSFSNQSTYMYMIEGLDEDYHEPNQTRFVTLNRLAPGEYTLKVKAANHDGVWMEEPREIRIIVTPPFWETAWFRTIVILTVLGLFLLILRWRTRRINARKEELEEEVKERTAEIVEQKEEIEHKNEEIMQSISYASRLQEAILPPQELMQKAMEKGFVLYMPKDVVAGDFYWFEERNGLVFFAVADCTGHGVPGAMVSVVCSTALNRCVKEFGITDAGVILDKTTDLVIETFERSHHNVQDGMDISLAVLDLDSKQLNWAGAHNPLWLLKNGETVIQETKGTKQPVAKYPNRKPFVSHNFQLETGDRIYLFSDGFPDQFGGEKGKKLKYKVFRELLESYKQMDIEEQDLELEAYVKKWMGNIEQVDDICVMGLEVS